MTKINIDQIDRVYSGRPGCACGCRGKYSESKRSKEIILKKYNETNPSKISESDDLVFWDNPEGTRTYTIYLKK